MFKTISVIIPVKPQNSNPRILEYLERIDYPKDKIEIMVVSGNKPSLQRNRGAQAAKGDILYFFNDDAQVPVGIFRKVIDIFNKRRDIAGVGGPDLTPADNSRLQHLFGYAMSSYFAHWKMRARYLRIGKERFSDERELLLSNMAVRKDIFLKFSGFNEGLYPNEENEMVNRMLKAGYRFIYSPDLKIYRDRRETIGEFLKQFYRYGQGRMDQIFIEGVFKNWLFFIPTFLLVYLFGLPLLRDGWVSLIPLFIYIFLAITDAVHLSFKNRTNAVFKLPLLYMLMHLSYASGMINRLFFFMAKRQKDGTAAAEIIFKFKPAVFEKEQLSFEKV
jgi:succinoglycan biosynthesis protein ExoA